MSNTVRVSVRRPTSNNNMTVSVRETVETNVSVQDTVRNAKITKTVPSVALPNWDGGTF